MVRRHEDCTSLLIKKDLAVRLDQVGKDLKTESRPETIRSLVQRYEERKAKLV